MGKAIKRLGKIVAPLGMLGFAGGAAATFVGTAIAPFAPPLGATLIASGVASMKIGGGAYLAGKLTHPTMSLAASAKKGVKAFATKALSQARNATVSVGKLGFFGGAAAFAAGAAISIVLPPLAASIMVPAALAMKAGAATYLAGKLALPVAKIAASAKEGPKTFAKNVVKGVGKFVTSAGKIAGKNAVWVGAGALAVGAVLTLPATAPFAMIGLAGMASATVGVPAAWGAYGVAAGAAAVAAKSAFILGAASIGGGVATYVVSKIGNTYINKSENKEKQNEVAKIRDKVSERLRKTAEKSRTVDQPQRQITPPIQPHSTSQSLESNNNSNSNKTAREIEEEELAKERWRTSNSTPQVLSSGNGPKLQSFSSQPLSTWTQSKTYQKNFFTKDDNPNVHYLKHNNTGEEKPAFAETKGQIEVMSTDEETVKALLGCLSERGVQSVRLEDASVELAQQILKNNRNMEILPSDAFKAAVKANGGSELVGNRAVMIDLYRNYISNAKGAGDINDKDSIVDYLKSNAGQSKVEEGKQQCKKRMTGGKSDDLSNNKERNRSGRG